MSAVLTATGLRKWFRSGDERIMPVDGVDLALSPREIVLVTGPSGSGKTTLLQMLTAFQRPDEGSVEWPGGGSMPSWSTLAVVPQSLGLLPELTVAENVALPLVALGRIAVARVAPRVEAALTLLGVDRLTDRLAGETSLGQQQRVAVARALVVGPKVLVADEPTSHQDHEHAHVVLRAIAAVAERGTACLLAGHDPLLAETATRVLRMENGRLA